MYRIMMAKSKKEHYQSLYQYLTATVEGVISPVEFETKAALDVYVEKLLNGDYAKSDFIVVKVVDYSIDAKDYSDEQSNTGNDNNN